MPGPRTPPLPHPSTMARPDADIFTGYMGNAGEEKMGSAPGSDVLSDVLPTVLGAAVLPLARWLVVMLVVELVVDFLVFLFHLLI